MTVSANYRVVRDNGQAIKVYGRQHLTKARAQAVADYRINREHDMAVSFYVIDCRGNFAS